MQASVEERVLAFDAAATTYDDEFENNPVTRHLRSIVWNGALRSFPRGAHVLDIGCGTGTDAVFLAGHGYAVTAVDGSEKMLEEAERKVATHGLQGLVQLRRLRFDKLGALVPETSEDSPMYEGVLSNFGGLNCTQSLPHVLRSVARMTKPHGMFIACVLGKICVWEMVSFFARGHFGQGVRRFRNSVARIGDEDLRVQYYTPRQLKRIAEPWFAAERVYGLGIISPLPNSRRFIERHPRMVSLLTSVEDAIRSLPPFPSLADHFVVEFRRSRMNP